MTERDPKQPPQPYNNDPRPGKATIGNRRTGNSRGVNNRRHTINWEKDRLILSRMALVEKYWAQGYSSSQMVDPVNEEMQKLGIPAVSLRTIKRDKARLLIRFEDESDGAKEQHISSLQLIKQKAWDSFENAPSGSLNKSSYLNTLRATEETIAKLDGSYTNKITVDGQVNVANIAMVLQKVLSLTVDAETAERVLESFSEEVSSIEQADIKA